ncbi:MAG: MGH1-like glycoside hydrolase domain-containing protein, partial [Planctomycetota bacterium]
GVLWGRPGGAERVGDHLRLRAGDGTVLTVHSSREPDAAVLFPVVGAHLAVPLDGPVAISTGSPRSCAEVRTAIAAARDALDARLARYGASAELAGAMASALGWCTIFDPAEGCPYTVVSRTWACRNGGGQVFCWDAFFAAMMAGALGDAELALGNWDAAAAPLVWNDCVPGVRNAMGSGTWGQSQPPVASMSLRYLADCLGDAVVTPQRVDALLRWNRWWPAHRASAGMLCWGSQVATNRNDSIYETTVVAHLRGARFESGLDNYPLYDDAGWDGERGLMRQADVGLIALAIRDCLELAELCRRCGRSAEVTELQERARDYRQALERCWDEADGIYRNIDLDAEAFVSRRGVTLFHPLLAGDTDPARLRRMLDEHLLDETAFWGAHVVPAVARDDPAFPEQDYWRGRIWAPLNLLLYIGLRQAGADAVASELAERGAALFLRNWWAHGYVAENYNAIDGSAGERANSDPFNPWGALLALVALMDRGAVPPLRPL